jgi:hypothetical protein
MVHLIICVLTVKKSTNMPIEGLANADMAKTSQHAKTALLIATHPK